MKAEHLELRKNAVGILGIILFVIASNGPLTVLLAGTPPAMTLGNGIGVPGAFLLVALVYVLFSVGFSAMARHIKNSGAFYAYISQGISKPVAVGSAFISISAYSALMIALYGVFGFFANLLISTTLGIEIPWWILCLIAILSIYFFSTRNVQFNGKMLSILIAAEIFIILLFDAAVVFAGGGPEGLSLTPFAPSHIFSSGLGVAIMFITTCFIGFETAAIYSEEAKDARKTVPRALFISVLLIGGFASISTWLMMSAYGPALAVSEAGKDAGAVWLNISGQILGTWSIDVMNILMTTSLFAALLSLTNILTRYIFALARENIIWHTLAKLHSTQQTPARASQLQMAILVIIFTVAGLKGVDPLNELFPITSALCALSIVSVQVLTSIAIIGFFKKQKRDTSIWERLFAPSLSIVFLSAILMTTLWNIDVLTNGSVLFNWLLPILCFALGIGGYLYTHWLKHHKPKIYHQLDDFLMNQN